MAMSGNAIVTGSDARTFPFLQGLVASLKRHPTCTSIPICFFDLEPNGWTARQREWFGRYVTAIERPRWDYPVEERRRLPFWFRGLVVRPFIPRYFPQYERFLYLDADTWVHDPSAVETYFAECEKGALVVSREDDPCYRSDHPTVERDFWAWQSMNFEKFFSWQTAETVRREVTPFNAGVFALRADAAHWAHWAHGMAEVMARAQSFGVDQVVLTWAVYEHHLPITLLPARYNWCCHRALPVWDVKRHHFSEPLPPYRKLGIIHLPGVAKQNPVQVVRDSTGQPALVRLIYPGGPCRGPASAEPDRVRY